MKAFVFMILGLTFSSSAFALNCHGTEPFWGATVSSTEITLEDPVLENKKVSVVQKVEAASGFTAEYMSIYSDNRGPLAIVMTRECNNGMSDDIFPKEIILFTDSGVLSGCCE